jgi:hypothetical protein
MLVRHRRGVEVLRDAIPKATLVPFLLRWSAETLPRLAQAIREERAFDRMPVLGDALEDAGAGYVLIAHCRSRRPHLGVGCTALFPVGLVFSPQFRRMTEHGHR